MVENVLQFKGETPADTQTIWGCFNCGSRTFKVCSYGRSLEPRLECANCENNQDWAEVKDVSDV
tara:strand:- start:9159 stop:9350 length:192 start_codon:yes stop_codon:yes gene_type:complete